MKRYERTVIGVLMMVLIATNLVFLLGRTGEPAWADAAAAMNRAMDADEIVLSGDDESGEIMLRNTEGRLAWGERAHERVYSVAYVHIGSILGQLMSSDSLQEERDELLEELSETEREFRAELDSMAKRLQELDPESSEAQELFAAGDAKWTEYREWQQEAIQLRGKLDASQLEQAYREMVSAVQVVADRMNIDVVQRFIPTDDPFEAENPEQAMLSIRLRSVLRYPDALDITDEVIEELALEVE